MRQAPEPGLVAWIDRFPTEDVVVTAVTAAELRHGVARLPEGLRKRELFVKVDGLLAEDFRDQVLPFDELAAPHYAEIVAARERAGRPISMADAQCAAICRNRSADLATRNVDDFIDTGVHVVEEASDGYEGMGYAVDVFIRDPDAQLATARRIADGIRTFLDGIPVATDSDLDEQIPAAPNRR
jgi:predicted nucleic acid-binding protein